MSEDTYPARWACYGCGEIKTLSPGEEPCCGRGVRALAEIERGDGK